MPIRIIPYLSSSRYFTIAFPLRFRKRINFILWQLP